MILNSFRVTPASVAEGGGAAAISDVIAWLLAMDISWASSRRLRFNVFTSSSLSLVAPPPRLRFLSPFLPLLSSGISTRRRLAICRSMSRYFWLNNINKFLAAWCTEWVGSTLNMTAFSNTRRHNRANSSGDFTSFVSILRCKVRKSIGSLITWVYVGIPKAIGSTGSLKKAPNSTSFSLTIRKRTLHLSIILVNWASGSSSNRDGTFTRRVDSLRLIVIPAPLLLTAVGAAPVAAERGGPGSIVE